MKLKISVRGGVYRIMKKITVLVLMLGLTVPTYAWHLFPVREKIVTVKETNYTALAGACAITLVVSLIAGKVIFGHKEAKSRPELIEWSNEAVADIEPEVIEPEVVERTDIGIGTYSAEARDDDHVFMTVKEYRTERACQRDAVICQLNESLNPGGLHIQLINGLWTLCMISGMPRDRNVYPIVRECLTRLMTYIRTDLASGTEGWCPIRRLDYMNMEDKDGVNRHGVK
jgi:hypothetical protein